MTPRFSPSTDYTDYTDFLKAVRRQLRELANRGDRSGLLAYFIPLLVPNNLRNLCNLWIDLLLAVGLAVADHVAKEPISAWHSRAQLSVPDHARVDVGTFTVSCHE